MKITVKLPFWIVEGICFSLWSPFATGIRTLSGMGKIVSREWVNRWAAGHPKKPDGKPMGFLTPEQMDYREAAIMEWVLRDYGEKLIRIRR